MAEPIPQAPMQTPELPKPEPVVVGETPIYLATPHVIGSENITSLTILSADKRANDGVGSIVPLITEASRKKGEEGQMIDKPLTNLNAFDEVSWDKVSGLQWTDESGTTHVIPKDQLSLTPQETAAPVAPEPAQEAAPTEPKAMTPETAPVLPSKPAREILETLTENPNIITIVGLKAYETRALDLADRSMQRLTPHNKERTDAQRTLWEKTKDSVHGLHEFVFTSIWKQSVGGIYFHEKSRQYYMDMLKAAETPFAEDSIRLAERRATDMYNKKLADANFAVRIGTKAWEWFKDKVGMRTAIQTLALQEMSTMKADGEIRGMETFDREAKAIRTRFGTDFDQADKFVRKHLGEKLEILDPENAEHKPLTEGIQSLLKQYASGEIADKSEFDKRTQEFFNATLKNTRPDIFAEAELYSSSLFDAAETLRTKLSHEAGLANVDEAIAGMQIRLGLGAMGEVTSLEPTAVEQGVAKVRDIAEWLNKKNVLIPLVFNEATIGSGVAIALSAANFVKTIPARALTGIGGGALAGGLFAGWREYGQLQRDYLTHLREKETGAVFTETQKRRAWFERFSVQQRSASEMITSLQSSLYEGTTPKATLTDDELRNAFATVADVAARKAVSETGPKRIGLIRFSNREAIETERAALDITANRALTDLDSYLASHAEQAAAITGGTAFADFMEKLTVTQTRVLREGVQIIANQDDPIHATLNLVSQYAPEAAIVRRRWPFASRLLTGDENAMGLDAIMDEFKKEARVEAAKYGIKAGVIGAAVGAAFHLGEAGKALQNLRPEDATIGHAELASAGAANAHSVELPISVPDVAHPVTIGGSPYLLPPEVSVTPHNGVYDAVIHAPGTDISIGHDLTREQLFAKLHDTGLTVTEAHDATSKIVTHSADIPGLFSTQHDALQAALPPGYTLDHVTPTGHPDNWNLVGPDHKAVVYGLKFNPDGSLENAADIQSKLSAAGFDLDATSETYTITHDIQAETLPATQPLPADLTIEGKTLGDGGIWDYFLEKTRGDNSMAATNGMKNLFRLYGHDHPDMITFPDGSPNENFFDPTLHPEHFRPATFGPLGQVQEMDLTKLPMDARFHVPSAIFGEDGINEFSTINDTAITRVRDLVAAGHAGDHVIRGQMDAINYLYESKDPTEHLQGIVLKLGYLGNDGSLPAKPEDIQTVITHLSGVSEATPPVPEVPTAPETFHKIIISAKPAEAAPGVVVSEKPLQVFYTELPDIAEPISGGAKAHLYAEAARNAAYARESIWVPVFLPYRNVLEAATGEVISASPLPAESLLSPFGMEASYLDKTTLESRKSPRLTEHADAPLKQSEEIAWYLSQLSPEETQSLETLLTQDHPPISPDVRAIVTIPAGPTSTNIYQTLQSYVGQTNADGTPLDPKRTEYIVFDAQLAPNEGETLPQKTKEDVERFRTEHPDMQILYAAQTYAEPPANGKMKRDATNFALSRIATLPTDAPDVAVISDSGTGTVKPPTYLSSVADTLDAQPTLDAVSGAYELPNEAYTDYPMLFAQHRAFEIMDSLVRHGDAGSVPGVYSGNIGLRAGSLAAVGGYNPAAAVAEDRELAWMIRQARGNADTMTTLPSMTATIDPAETVYTHLQQLGLADTTVPLSQNDVYKDMPWKDMAQKANDSYTKEQLETHLTGMYEHMYPSLKTRHPARFDAYFKRTMDTLGLQYEITDGTVTLMSTERLAENMSAPMDIEPFAKDAAVAVVEATPLTPPTPRETLASLAQTETPPPAPEPASNETVTTGISSPEVPIEQQSVEPMVSEMPAPEPTQPEQTGTPDLSPETVANVEGVENRINYVLDKTKTTDVTAVALSPGELMDYVRSSVELPGARITGGTITIDGNTVKLTDMKAKTVVGDAHFSGTLVTDPARGLTVQKDTLTLNLPLLARPWQKSIHDSLDNFNTLVLSHLDSRINPQWKADRIDIAGDKLQVTFGKKPAG